MTELLHLRFRAVTLDESSDAQLLSPRGETELGAHAANSEGRKAAAAQIITFLW